MTNRRLGSASSRLVEGLRYLRTVLDHPLNADRKAEAVVRWLRWHVGSRVAPGAVAVPFVNQARLLVRPGMRGATENIYTGLAEFSDMAFVLHALRPGDRFLDVGSNVGVYTVLAAAVCGAACVAAEPVRGTFLALLDNLRLNGIEHRVEARNLALSDAECTVTITADEDCRNHIVLAGEGAHAVEHVQAITADQLLGGEPVTLMKIDVEGFEINVLRGAGRILSDPRLLGIIIELNGSGDRYGNGDHAVHRLIAAHGFWPYRYEPFLRSLVRLEVPSEDRNTIYVRDVAAVADRLHTAAAFRVLGRNV